MSTILDQIQFAPERKEHDIIVERYSLDPIIRNFQVSDKYGESLNEVPQSSFKLNSALSPRVFSILDEVRKTLSFEEPIDVYVETKTKINAWAVRSVNDEPHMLGLTSRLLEKATDNELRFVLGHEIGHLHYDHSRLAIVIQAVGKDEDDKVRLPDVLTRKILRWVQKSEFSADRAGYVAVQGDMESIVSIFFKILSGLGPEHLQFDISAFLNQIEELKSLKGRELINGFTHPITPVRARAVQLFGEAGGADAAPGELAGVDAAVLEVAKLMDYDPWKPLEVNSRNAILGGGLIVTGAHEKGLSEKEEEFLARNLLQWISDPEEVIPEITFTEAQEMLESGTAWFKENSGEARFIVFHILALLAVIDGDVQPERTARLMSIAKMLGIPDGIADQKMQEEVLRVTQVRHPLQSRQPGMSAFNA